MAIVTNTFTTFDAKGIREDLSNVITNIATEETPYMSNIGSRTVSNSLYEWQTDTLAAAAANKQLEGDDVTSLTLVNCCYCAFAKLRSDQLQDESSCLLLKNCRQGWSPSANRLIRSRSAVLS